jgi:hypothetical protein
MSSYLDDEHSDEKDRMIHPVRIPERALIELTIRSPIMMTRTWIRSSICKRTQFLQNKISEIRSIQSKLSEFLSFLVLNPPDRGDAGNVKAPRATLTE